MSGYVTGRDLEGRCYVGVLEAEGSGVRRVAYARNTMEALQIIHYLNGGSDPAAAAVVAEYQEMLKELPTPIADAVGDGFSRVKGLVTRKKSKDSSSQ